LNPEGAGCKDSAAQILGDCCGNTCPFNTVSCGRSQISRAADCCANEPEPERVEHGEELEQVTRAEHISQLHDFAAVWKFWANDTIPIKRFAYGVGRTPA
jgi:hypothetical protein